MKERFKMDEVQPEAYTAMAGFENYMKTTKIAPLHKEMIKIRASQINGCAYCVNIHTRDARKLGETEQRINLISVWREAPQFTEEERVILEMTEEVTLIHRKGLSDEVYEKALSLLGEEKTSQVLMAIITINAWNRLGVGLRKQPQ